MVGAPTVPEPGLLTQLSPGHRVGPCLGRSGDYEEFLAKGCNLTIHTFDYDDNGALKTKVNINLRNMAATAEFKLGLSFSYDIAIGDITMVRLLHQLKVLCAF